MKRSICIALAIALSACLTACSAGIVKADASAPAPDSTGELKATDMPASGGTPLFEFMGGDTLEHAKSFEDEAPVAVGYRFDGVAGGEYSYVCDPDFVRGVFNALDDMRVQDEADVYMTDNYIYYKFVMADGSDWGVAFNGENLDFDGKVYTVAGGDALSGYWFVGYQYDNVFCAYPDAAMREFADSFYDLNVASVSCSEDGAAAVELTDPEQLERAYEAISYSHPYAMGGYPAAGADGVSDTPPRTVVFTLTDGTEYTLEFEGRNLSIGFPEPIGMQYYWLGEEIDPLFELF